MNGGHEGRSREVKKKRSRKGGNGASHQARGKKKGHERKVTGHEREVKSGRGNEMDMNWGVVMEER